MPNNRRNHKRRDPLQLMVLELSLGIAAAIRHLHSKQVVHGDLNPRNVLLKRDSAALAGYVPKVRAAARPSVEQDAQGGARACVCVC